MADQSGVASRRREASAPVAWEPRAGGAQSSSAEPETLPQRHVRLAPLRLHTLTGLERGPGLETRLPQLFLLGFGLLAAIQLILTH